MKRPLFILVLFATFIITTSFLTVDIDIFGKMYSDDLELNKELVGIELFAKYKDHIVAKTLIDNTGHYEITINVSLSNGISSTYDFYFTGLGVDTCFIKSFRQFNGEEMTWDIKLPNKYKKNKGRVVCPKCGTIKETFPIIYGNKQLTSEKIVDGNPTRSNIIKGKYYAGTCIHSKLSPNWYCDKDKIKF